MDYVRPVETVIPGVQGRVLGVLTRSETAMTMRTVARLAGVSAQQASVILSELVHLGVVSRQEAGSSALVSLDRSNEAGRLIAGLADLRYRVLERLREDAKLIDPAPASLIVFGSFARGEADADSDIDVLAVRPHDIVPDNAAWVDSLGSWEIAVRKATGNGVNTIVVGADEVPMLLRRRSGPWRDIVRDGVVLLGRPLTDLVSAA